MLRVGAALALIQFEAGGLTNLDSAIDSPWRLVPLVGALALLLGLWTPVAGALVAIAEICGGFAPQFAHPGDRFVHLLLALLATSVAMLGPGAWSLDARLFGRKRFELNGRSRHG